MTQNNTAKTKVNSTNYNTTYKPTWCPGCGNFGILMAIKNALTELNIPSHKVAIVYGIGCAGNMANLIKAYSFHSLHGRTLPVAEGIKLANKDLTVIAIAGDGDQYAEGMNHLIHGARYNSDINLIVCNNRTFSLTTGQSSPTSDFGYVTKTTPYGEVKKPVNPLALSITAGATFVARGAAFELKHLTNLIKSAIQHAGFSHVDVLQQCVTFNKQNTVAWYKEKIRKLEDERYNPDNIKLAWQLANEKNNLPIGVFYKEDREVYVENFEQMRDFLLVDKKIKFDRKNLLAEFR